MRECPVLRATLDDLRKPFEAFIEKHERKIAQAGIAKIVLASDCEAWSPRRQGYPDDLDFTIERPIRQHATGSRGLYRGLYIEEKPMSLKDVFRPQALSPDNQAPPVSHPSDLERKYWKLVTLRPPLYGADVLGSLFDEDGEGWNLRRLDTILTRVLRGAGHSLPGVSEPYLYFGTWRSTFAWHTEDVDLYSVNYLHYGAPKQWYCIPPDSRRRFEGLIKGMLPDLFKACPEFFRHKELIISPQLLDTFAIPYIKTAQYPREFVINYPGAYHAGYNCGYNCAESVNFGTRRWVPLGAAAAVCCCNPDSVTIDMRLFRDLVPARLLPPSIFEDTSSEEEDDEDEDEGEEDEAGGRKGAEAKRGSGSGAGGGRGRRRPRGRATGGGRAMAAAAVVAAAPPPRRRGRPPRAAAATAAAGAAASDSFKRSRRKSHAETPDRDDDADNAGDDEQAEPGNGPAAKRRCAIKAGPRRCGRPPKAATTPATTADAVPAASTLQQQPAQGQAAASCCCGNDAAAAAVAARVASLPRRRGRPPKSPLAACGGAAVATAASAVPPGAAQPSKRPRGRPRKHSLPQEPPVTITATAVAVPGVVVIAPSDGTTATAVAAAFATTTNVATAAAAPAVAGATFLTALDVGSGGNGDGGGAGAAAPGPSGSQPAAAATTVYGVVPQKRLRGRPRKHPLPDPPNTAPPAAAHEHAASSVDAAAATAVAVAAAPVARPTKRPRGRPRKHPRPEPLTANGAGGSNDGDEVTAVDIAAVSADSPLVARRAGPSGTPAVLEPPPPPPAPPLAAACEDAAEITAAEGVAAAVRRAAGLDCAAAADALGCLGRVAEGGGPTESGSILAGNGALAVPAAEGRTAGAGRPRAAVVGADDAGGDSISRAEAAAAATAAVAKEEADGEELAAGDPPPAAVVAAAVPGVGRRKVRPTGRLLDMLNSLRPAFRFSLLPQ